MAFQVSCRNAWRGPLAAENIQPVRKTPFRLPVSSTSVFVIFGLAPILFTTKAIWWGKRSVCVVCRVPDATDHAR
jgi:hypothetical protein